MSTKSLKSFTSRAKRSMSGLNPFCDAGSSPEKENDTPDLEDFGLTMTFSSSAYSDAHPLSPAKGSPSRRKKLMGSLRSVGSLQSLRSPPRKERGVEHGELSVYPDSPRTPIREVTSLALDFQESPPDQPMFGALQRKDSVSSSLVVQRSSPVAILTSSTRESTCYSVAAHHSGIPPGTVPNSPTPLQKALEKDAKHFGLAIESSPTRLQMDGCVEPLPTPMPGTNIGFNHYNLNQSSSSLLSKAPSVASGYFAVPTVAHWTRMETRPHLKLTDSESPEKRGPAPLGLSEAKTTDLTEHIDRCGSLVVVRSPLKIEQKKQETTTNTDPAENLRLQESSKVPTGAFSSPIDCNHVVFEDSFELSTTDGQSAHNASGMRPAEARINLQMQTQKGRKSAGPHTRSITVDDTPLVPVPHHTWGTHGSLYDGTGYGNNASSIFTRPTTSSTVAEIPWEPSSDGQYTAACLAQDSAAMARDHEALEEVIRAYAALEERAASSATEDAWEDVLHDDCTRDGVVETMAKYSLGA